MVRKTALVTAMLGAFASQAMAMGLGEIQLHSALNQPLLAEIELLSPTAADLNDLHASLASSAAYAKAGVERTFFHTRLRFTVDKRADGTAVIKVTSHDPVREPYLDFLLDVTWGSGQALREYTVLVDPPVLMPALAPTLAAPETDAHVPARSTAAPAQSRSSGGTDNSAASSRLADGQYEVGRNDTTWAVAKAVRPDSSVNMEQVMISLLQANPSAFSNQNINNLKAGEILRVPSREDMAAISVAEAHAAVQAQSNQWRGGNSAAAPTQTATPATETDAPATVPAAADTAAADSAAADPQLKLVAPKTGAAADKTVADGQSVEALREELTLATESVAAKSQENTELNSRVKELEDQISKLHGLIELKNSEMAKLSGNAAPTADVGEAAPAMPKDAMVAEDATEAAPVPGADTSASMEGADAETVAPTTTDSTAAPETDKAEPVPNVPAPKVVATPKPQIPDAGSEDMLTSLLANPLVQWGVAGAALLAGLLAWMSGRRRNMASAEFQESILADKKSLANKMASSAASTAASVGAVSAAAKKEIDEVVAKDSAQADSAQTDSSMFTDFAVSDLGAVPNDVEADPVAEADVYLAYGRYQQAEELIRGALNRNAQDSGLRFKLLEVLSAAKNANAFDTEAEALLAVLGSPENEMWLRVVEMGKELNPANPLYTSAGAAGMGAVVGPELDLEFDLGGTGETEVDFSTPLEFSTTKSTALDSNTLDFDLGELDAFTTQLEEAAPSMPIEEDFNYDLGAGDDEDASEGELSSADEVATKLDLARAYVEMGDPEGARSILQEVLEEGDGAQKAEAQTLLSAIV